MSDDFNNFELWDTLSSIKDEEIKPKKNVPKLRDGPTPAERLMEYMDKPKNITQTKLDTFFRKLRIGNPPDIAAKLATFKPSDITKWLDRGERYEESFYGVFLEEYNLAVAQCMSVCTTTIMNAIKANTRQSPRLAMEMAKMLAVGTWAPQSNNQVNNIEVNNPNSLHQNAYLSIDSPEIKALDGLSDDAFENAFGDLNNSNNSLTIDGILED